MCAQTLFSNEGFNAQIKIKKHFKSNNTKVRSLKILKANFLRSIVIRIEYCFTFLFLRRHISKFFFRRQQKKNTKS